MSFTFSWWQDCDDVILIFSKSWVNRNGNIAILLSPVVAHISIFVVFFEDRLGHCHSDFSRKSKWQRRNLSSPFWNLRTLPQLSFRFRRWQFATLSFRFFHRSGYKSKRQRRNLSSPLLPFWYLRTLRSSNCFAFLEEIATFLFRFSPDLGENLCTLLYCCLFG